MFKLDSHSSHRNGVVRLLMLSSLLLPSGLAYAEGGDKNWTGAYGVNRVVRTNSEGYVEVEGEFQVTSTLPSRTNANVKAHDNRPNVYFGGDVNGIEFDAGLIWEPDLEVVNGDVYGAGWAAFIKGRGVETSPQVWLNNKSRPWRYYVGSTELSANITSTMRLTFEDDGSIALFLDKLPGGTFYHNNTVFPASASLPLTPSITQKLNIVDTSHLGVINIKRVVAVTRAGGKTDRVGYNDELDGTEMMTTFSLGKVRKHGGDLSDWLATDINQNETGYDSAANNATNRRAWDNVVKNAAGQWVLSTGASSSRTVTEFPNLDVGNIVGRTNTPASHTALENGVSRYQQETVKINLRVVGAPQGRGRE